MPILGKLLEKLLLKRINAVISKEKLIPEHQFGFRKEHSTIEQVHRLVEIINQTFEEKSYCSAAFLDVSQAFDKVWHEGLLFKIKRLLPHTLYGIIESYIQERYFQIKFDNEISELHKIQSGVPQGSVLGPTLYLLFTADLPTNEHTTLATFADDKAILSKHSDPNIATNQLQQHLIQINRWTRKWRITINETKSAHIVFTKCRGVSPQVHINSKIIPRVDCVKYLGMHLDKTLTWRTHIWKKRKQLGLKFSKYYWLLGKNSQLSLRNKLLVYKAAFKPIWTYGIQLWGTASNSNIEILERFQSKILRAMTGAPYFIPNSEIREDVKVNTVKSEVVKFSAKYLKRLETHSNTLAINLLDNSEETQRLKRYQLLQLPFRFK